MPGLASAEPHTLSTLSITRMNGGSRSNSVVSPVRNVEQMDPTVLERIDQRRGFTYSKESNITHADEIAAEESLSLYCKPVELYNIIQRRALRNPLFLQRCLSYKIQVARQKRVKMTIRVPRILSASGEVFWNSGKAKEKKSCSIVELQELQFLPVFVMLTSPISKPTMGNAVYRFSRTWVLKVPLFNVPTTGVTGQAGVTFLLPEVRKLLLTAKRDGDVILFITFADSTILCNGKGAQVNTLVNFSGPVLWGSLPITTFCHSWLSHLSNCASTTGLNGDRLDGTFQVELYPSRLQQHEDFADGQYVRFHMVTNGSNAKSMVRLQLCISAVEVGRTLVKQRCGSEGHSNCGHVSTSSLFHQARRFRAGRVIFRYYYYFNQLYKSEVTGEYSCPFCLVGCASFKGLSCHLNSTHDLFNFEFLATPDYQVVNVTCRNDMLGPEGNVRDVDGLNDPRLKNFVYWSRSGRPRKFCDRTAASAQSLDSEQPPPALPETASFILDATRLQEPTSLTQTIDSALQDHKCNSSPESQFMIDDSNTLNLDQNLVQNLTEKEKNQLPVTSSNSLAVGAVASEPSVLEVKARPLQEELDKHERDEQEEHVPKVSDEANLSLQPKTQISEGTADDEAKVDTSGGHSQPSPSTSGVCLATATTMPIDECVAQTSVKELSHSAGPLQENRKISIERAEARKYVRALLQKQQFFHSHTAQPMSLEQLFSDRDSEDEVDDEIADFEDRRMLDDFVDVTQDEKQLMHLWNSFVRKQRVIADGHCPWACEAFSKLHAAKFAASPALRRCLMLFLIKLWNHHLVDGGTINRCLSTVDSYDEKPLQG